MPCTCVLSFGGFAINYEVIDIILRLGAAAAVGVIIGINRDLTNKPIGMRTLGLVSLGAAVASLATIQFEDLAAHPDALSRVVQGIIQGIIGRDKLYRCGCHSTRCSSPDRRRINDGSNGMGHSRTRDSGLAAWTIVGAWHWFSPSYCSLPLAGWKACIPRR
jgi:MgtC family